MDTAASSPPRGRNAVWEHPPGGLGYSVKFAPATNLWNKDQRSFLNHFDVQSEITDPKLMA